MFRPTSPNVTTSSSKSPVFATATVLAALVGLALGGCADSRPLEPLPGAPLDQLVRQPDRVFDQPGVLVPDEDVQWGELGVEGWFLITLPELAAREEGDLLHVRTNQPSALLRLPAGAPRDRTLKLVLWCQTAVEETPRLTLHFNGETLADGVALPREPTELTFEVPAAAWIRGENLLILESSRTPDERWNELALARVAYDEPLQVQATDGRLALAPGTGALYVLESVDDELQLELGTAASRPGTLQVEVRPMQARTGDEGDLLLSLSLPAHDLTRGALVALPPTPTGLYAVSLLYDAVHANARHEEPLVVNRLRLRPAHDVARPSVVFLSIDSLTARHMSVYGYERETTPRLTELAREAVVFERCLTNAPWTMPSYLSVITGLYPQSHRIAGFEPAEGQKLAAFESWQVAESRWTMAEQFRALGYRTAASVDTHWLWKQFRVDQGFDLYDFEPSQISLTDPYGGIALIHHKLKGWLDQQSTEVPFFLFLHALDVHGPYVPGPEHENDFPVEEPAQGWTMDGAGSAFQTYKWIPEWMARTHALDGDLPVELALKVELPEELAVEPIVATYDEAIRKTDDYIGRILDELEARGLADDTILVISADHGEAFRSDFYGHGAMWEPIVHVPLIVRFPHGEFGGRRVTEAVQLVDLYPTLSDFLLGRERSYLHGRSLMPLVRGEREEPRVLYAEEGHCEQYLVEHDGWKLVVEYPGRQSAMESILSHPRVPDAWLQEHVPELLEHPLTPARFKELLRREGEQVAAAWSPQRRAAELPPGLSDEQRAQKIHSLGFEVVHAWVLDLKARLDGPYMSLYRVADDPDETNDLAAQHPERVQELLALLAREQDKWKRSQAEGRPIVRKADLSAATLEALKALGYVGEDAAEAPGAAGDELEDDSGDSGDSADVPPKSR